MLFIFPANVSQLNENNSNSFMFIKLAILQLNCIYGFIRKASYFLVPIYTFPQRLNKLCFPVWKIKWITRENFIFTMSFYTYVLIGTSNTHTGLCPYTKYGEWKSSFICVMTNWLSVPIRLKILNWNEISINFVLQRVGWHIGKQSREFRIYLNNYGDNFLNFWSDESNIWIFYILLSFPLKFYGNCSLFSTLYINLKILLKTRI